MRLVIRAMTLASVAMLIGCGQQTAQRPATTKPAATQNPQPPANTDRDPAAKGKAEDQDGKGADDSDGKAAPADLAQAKVRSFTFQYRFKVKGLTVAGDEAKDAVRVWLPSPPADEFQKVKQLTPEAPADLTEQKEARFGNLVLYAQFALPKDGEFTIDVPYQVERREVLGKAGEAPIPPGTLSDELHKSLVAADKLVPITGKSLKLLEPLKLKSDKLSVARQLYDVVDEHVVYKKEGTGWGRGDTDWVCDNGYGNCTDFHSLFMSLARSQGIPAKFEIGFSIPTDKPEGPIAGYHCWAWFHVDGKGWVPVDISEADKHPELKEYYFGNLTADRVTFSTGRDQELVPKPASGPLNFFIYPYIEVGDQPLPKENLELQFAYKNEA